MSIKIDIITGLPGSGKTTLANKMFEKITKNGYGKPCVFIPLDNYKDCTLQEAVEKRMCNFYKPPSCHNIIVEGLMLSNESIVSTLNELKNYLRLEDDIKVCLHYFNEDREACLHNDIGRRNQNARITIQNAAYEIPNCKYISKETGLFCESKRHNVVRKSDYDIFRDTNNLGRADALYSSSWSLGGTYGDCWSDNLYSISPEEPVPFREFDNLLEKICPNISFLQYKKLERECVSIKQYGESDYYGGYEVRADYVCDLKKLYDLLNEMGCINSEEMIEENEEEVDR